MKKSICKAPDPGTSKMKKINILLVRTTNVEDLIPPLGLLYIASIIQNKYKSDGCQIKLIDYMYEGLDDDIFTKIVLEFSPDFILFSSMDSEYALFRRLCILARKTIPECPLIAGGNLATNYHTEIIAKKLVDFVVRGEGELTIIELLDAVIAEKKLSNVKGITYRAYAQTKSILVKITKM